MEYGRGVTMPSETELSGELLLVALVEMSAKIRSGDPIDEPADIDGPHWAGHVPLCSVWEPPVGAADLRAGIAVPTAIAARAGQQV